MAPIYLRSIITTVALSYIVITFFLSIETNAITNSGKYSNRLWATIFKFLYCYKYYTVRFMLFGLQSVKLEIIQRFIHSWSEERQFSTSHVYSLSSWI